MQIHVNLIKLGSYNSIMATTVEEHPTEGSVAMDNRNLHATRNEAGTTGTPTAAPSGAIATDAAPANGATLAPASAGEEITSEERYRRLRTVIKPDMDPSLVWPTLRDRGWACKPGRGLVSYYIVCSKFADESVAFMLKNAVRGDEYFCSEDELKVFCRERLGWIGGSTTKRKDVPPSTGEDSEKEEAEEHWNLIAIHRASDIRDGKYKCAGCRRLTACSVWIKGGSFGDQWHCCVDCQSIHFDLKGKAFPTVKSGDLPSSLDAILDSHRTIIAEICSTEFRSDQILDDLPTKAVSTTPRTASSASYPSSLLKTPAPVRRATTSTSASKRNKTPKKQSATRSKKAKKVGGKPAEKVAKTSRKNQKSTKAKKATSTPTITDTKTLEGREKPDRTSSSRTNTTTGTSHETIRTWNEPRSEGAITSEERYRRLGSLIKPDMDPSLVWPTLNDHGWACKAGKGLISYYFVCSKYADKSLQFILENAVRGDEYFCSESEVRDFCREKLGWVGSGSGSDNNRRDRRPSSRHGRASSRHQNMPSGSKGAETTPSMAKKRPSSPEAQQIPHANAKRHAVESKLQTVATGSPHKLRFTTDTDTTPSTPSTLAIKVPSEATLQNVLEALASPTEYDPNEELWETETADPAHPPVDGKEAMGPIPQNDDVSANYDSDATVPKSMPEPMPMPVPDEFIV